MTLPRSFPVFVVVFTAAFAVIYILAVEYNLAPFTYHPALNQWGLLVERPKDGPAMYWYGWLVASAVGAGAVAALACLLPGRFVARLWSGFAWLVPLVVMLVVVYLLRGYFLR
jgi:hypothetical protein